jgi:hypothetical protein
MKKKRRYNSVKRWFKRVLVAISCATLGATLAFGFASCKDKEESSSNQPAACTHVWNDGTVKTAATCTVDGTMLYTCTKCGETKTDKIASGHKYQTTVVEATCFSDGYTLNVCSACGSTKKTNVTAGQHNYVKTTTEATCLSDGATSFTCSGCGDSYRDVTERATGHNTTGCKWESSNEQVGACTW